MQFNFRLLLETECLLQKLGHFGGLLGLCFGFSLINVAEIIYFATIRLYQHISNSKQTFQHKPQSMGDRKTRDLYVNDFKAHNRRVFR